MVVGIVTAKTPCSQKALSFVFVNKDDALLQKSSLGIKSLFVQSLIAFHLKSNRVFHSD